MRVSQKGPPSDTVNPIARSLLVVPFGLSVLEQNTESFSTVQPPNTVLRGSRAAKLTSTPL
jgi:hypothetical protein